MPASACGREGGKESGREGGREGKSRGGHVRNSNSKRGAVGAEASSRLEAERVQLDVLQRRAEQLYDGTSAVLGACGAVLLFCATAAFTWRVQYPTY